MAYNQTTFTQAQAELLLRLSDSLGVFWSATPNASGYNEAAGYIQEALRTWGAFTHFWRDRGTLSITASSPLFIDLTALANASGTAIRSYNITTADLMAMMEFQLLEPATPTSYSGSGMFTQADFLQAIQRRLNQFLFETGCTLTHSQQAVSGNEGRVQLAGTIALVRRTGWISANGALAAPIWRADEWEMAAFVGPAWNRTSGQPQVFSIIAPPPLALQLAPIPDSNFTLDLLTISNGPTLDPLVLLQIPDEVSWAVKWGAMADLLGKDGPAFDPQRSSYCEARYQEGVQLANILPVLLQAQVNGVLAPPASILDLDQTEPSWQGSSGVPMMVAAAGANLIATYPNPNSTYTLTLDVAANPVVPAQGSDYIQLGQEELDVVLDYAQHLASFKLGGQEFQATKPLYDNFIRLALSYNQTLRASSKFLDVLWGESERENALRARRSESSSEAARRAKEEQSA